MKKKSLPLIYLEVVPLQPLQAASEAWIAVKSILAQDRQPAHLLPPVRETDLRTSF